mgnify:CR=1
KGKSEPVSIYTVFDSKETLKDSNFLEDHNEFLKKKRRESSIINMDYVFQKYM